MVTPYEGYVQVCEELARLTPGTHEKRSALFNSGSEAVENAVKIARLATGRQAVVAFDHGYHGRTNLTMALTAKNMPYKNGFGPFAPEIYRMPMAYPFRWPTGPEHCGEEAAAQAIAAMDSQIGAANLACIVIEPIQGEGGFIVPGEGFLPRLAEYCRANGIVFVADEIQTGFARTGDWFACEHEGVVPDLITTAKGIAGGPAAGRRHRPGRTDGQRPRRRARRHVRRQPGGLRGRARRHPHHRGARVWSPARARIGEQMAARLHALKASASGHRRRSRPRRDAGHRARRAGQQDAESRCGAGDCEGLPRRRAWSC